MYTIQESTLTVTKDTGESFLLSDINSPHYADFLAWRALGNLPSVIIADRLVFRIENYVDEDILGSKKIESINFQTETSTPLLVKEIREHGWLHSKEYYGYNEVTQEHDILVIRMDYNWTHNALGFATHKQKRLYYYDVDGVDYELKTFPREDVSLKAIEIGRERRRTLTNDLQIPTLNLIGEVIMTATPEELTLWGIDLAALSAGGQAYLLGGIARPFLVSLSLHIEDYVNNHNLSGILEHITNRPELWLDETLGSINSTLRQYLLNEIT